MLAAAASWEQLAAGANTTVAFTIVTHWNKLLLALTAHAYQAYTYTGTSN
jgi:hypothetical protein